MQQVVVELRERRHEHTNERQRRDAPEQETGKTSRPAPGLALLHLPCCRTDTQMVLAHRHQGRQDGETSQETEQLATAGDKAKFCQAWEVSKHDDVKGQDSRERGSHDTWTRLPRRRLHSAMKIIACSAFFTIACCQVNPQIICQANENRSKGYRENIEMTNREGDESQRPADGQL